MNWPVKKLGEYADAIMGQAPPGEDCNKKGIGTPFVKAGEFGEERPVIREWTTKPLKFAKEDDVLLCVVGATCGKINKGADCAIGRSVAAIRANQKQLDNSYLYYFLSSWTGRLRAMSQGAAQTVISKEMIEGLEIPLPPINEQQRIAAILDKADAIRRKRQEAIKLAEEFLRSVFLDMFGDPVTNPKGWEVRPLGKNIIQANNGLSRRRKVPDNFGEIVLRLQDVHYEGIHFHKELNRIELDASEKKRYLVNKGDILFIRVNGNPDYVGRSSVFEGYKEDVYHNDHLIRLKFVPAYDPVFLSYCFNYEGGRKIISKQIKTSAGQHTISQSGIEMLEFYMPPISLQKKFVLIRNSVINIPFDVDLTNDLFASLSQKAFSGQV